jgi:O-acetyl-ADP-ribose deacetylase (regulator of RNase III)
MITVTEGNLLDARVEALVNTVNTVGVMGKGIALMFKDAFPENTVAYQAAARRKEINVGRRFVTERKELFDGPMWIINFPTKKHWRHPSRIEWIEQGLVDLKQVIEKHKIQSIAIPPLGSGNGGLVWHDVRVLIINALESLRGVKIIVYEPTKKYQNVSKRHGLEKLTPPRAMVAELVRRYAMLGFECSLLEIQKLAYFLERRVIMRHLENELDLRFQAHRYGPYSPRLTHLLEGLDGSYLHCGKRLADAEPSDVIWFDEGKKDKVSAYLSSGEAKIYREALEDVATLIDGFESPLGMELLATIDWLMHHEHVGPTTQALRAGLLRWQGGPKAGERKSRLFDDRLIKLAVERLTAE